MTLLNPVLWLGLFLAGVPILLHLLARRRLHRQPFPALDFLKQLQSSRLKNIRFRRWLLLALRTLAVLLIAFAFLRPAFRAWGSGSGANATVVLLDLSASMSMRLAGSTPLARAKERLGEIWREGGDIALVVNDHTGARDLPFQRAGGEPPAWIGRLSVDGRADDPAAGLRRAYALLAEREEPVREVLWISDFATPSKDTLPPVPDGISLLRIDVGPEKTPRNAAVTGVRLLEPLPVPGELAGLEVQLAQTGAEVEDSVLVVVNLDGRRAAEGRVDLPVSGTARQVFALRLPTAGQHAVSVEAEVEDALALDNRRFAVLEVSPRRRVLVAGDDFSGMRSLELGLTARAEGGIEARVVRGELTPAQLADADVVFLVGRQRPSPEESKRLASFVESGGGLWLIAGETVDLALWNRRLLPVLSLGRARELLRFGGRGVAWKPVSSHPVFSGLWMGPEALPHARRAIAIEPDAGATTLLQFDETHPALLESSLGEGTVWWMPGAVNSEWTDWAFSGIFAPMVQRGAVYLASGHGDAEEVACGEVLQWRKLPGSGAPSAVDALGNEVPVASGAEQGSWSVDATEWPGHVVLSLGEREAAIGAVNLPHRESSLDVRWAETLEGEPLNNTTPLAEQLAMHRRGREFAGALLLAALAVLALESLVARETGREVRGDGGK